MDDLRRLALIVLLLAAFASYRRCKDVLYPGFLQSGLWFMILSVYTIFEDRFRPLSGQMVLLIVFGVIAFGVGCLVATTGYDPRVVHRPIVARVNNTFLTRLLFWMPIVMLPFFVRYSMSLGQDGPFDSTMRNLRYAVSRPDDAPEGYKPFTYLVPLSLGAATVELFRRMQRGGTGLRANWRVIVSAGVAVVYGIFFTGRTFLVHLATVMLGVGLIYRRISLRRGAFYYALFGLAAFAAAAIVFGKGGSVGNTFSENVQGVSESFIVYLLAALPAMDLHVQTAYPTGHGEHVFRTFFAILAAMGYVDKSSVPPTVLEFVFVPVPINVYTVYQPYVDDFGLVGALAAQFLLGVWHGIMFRRARFGHVFSVYLFAITLYPLVMQFFQDQYVGLLSLWVQYFLMGVVGLWDPRPLLARLGLFARLRRKRANRMYHGWVP